jgi:serine/threonine protein kinase
MDNYDMDARTYLKTFPQLVEREQNEAQAQSEIRFLRKVVHAIANMHSVDTVHRDIKPENLLLNVCGSNADENNTQLTSVITNGVVSDMGSAKILEGDPWDTIMWTDYVTTRWYRAPEMCDQFIRGHFTKSCDVWSLGCMLFEFATRVTLFPGTSCTDQLSKIVCVIGSPPEDSGFVARFASIRDEENANALQREMEDQDTHRMLIGTNLESLVDKYSTWNTDRKRNIVSLLKEIFVWTPEQRPSAKYVLNHPLFSFEEQDHMMGGDEGYRIKDMLCYKNMQEYEGLYLSLDTACKHVIDTSNLIRTLVRGGK